MKSVLVNVHNNVIYNVWENVKVNIRARVWVNVAVNIRENVDVNVYVNVGHNVKDIIGKYILKDASTNEQLDVAFNNLELL